VRVVETRLLINGELVGGDGEPLLVENPATEQEIATVRLPSTEQVEAAIGAADAASRGWGRMPATERAELLHEVASRIRAQTDELARVVENSDEVGWTPRRSTTTRRWAATSAAA
jgi:aminobutyraldehyde dehydrogenase